MFLLRLFGGVHLEDESGPLSGRVAQRRRLALLAMLALEHPRPVGRDKLIALLWPEHDTERARHLLRDSLYLLRNTLGEDALVSAGDELRLNSRRLRCDVWEFEAALQQDHSEDAVRAYRGSLLDGFHAGGAPELEHWVDAARTRLARAYAKALEALAEEAARRKDANSAVEWWRCLAAEDRCNSRIILRLMEALEAAGDRAGAIQQARIHATLLEHEFEAEPDAEVEALAERIRMRPAQPTAAAQEQPVPDGGVRPAVVSRAPAADAASGPASGPASGQTGPPPAAGPPATAGPATDGASDPAAPPAAAAPTPRRRLVRTGAVLAAAVTFGFGAVLTARMVLSGGNPPLNTATEAAAADVSAIAVLPCSNLTRDADEDYFSDGLTEEIIGVLSRLRALRVAARTSVFAFKGENRDIREIGRALDVGTVLECGVRKEDDRVRVIVQLINVADGFHLWSQTYDRELTDIFAIQSDLALRIVQALEAELAPAERRRLARRPTTNPQAYTLYQRGRYFWNQRTSGAYAQAIDYFEGAIAADPQYAMAYAGLASVYSMQGLSGDLTPPEASERTRVTALKALELDDELAEAHTVLGGYYHVHAWDSEAAEREHLRAIELDPNYSTARHWYGNFLTPVGRLEEAIAQKRKSVELDPLSPHLNNSLGSTLLAAGRPDEALVHFRDSIVLDSLYWGGHAGMGEFFEATGQLEEAVLAYRRAAELLPRERLALARVLALTGQENQARRMLAELQADATRTGLFDPFLASVLLALDDVEGALAWLDRSYETKHPILRFLRRGGVHARLDDDPRFLDLLNRIGITDTQPD